MNENFGAAYRSSNPNPSPNPNPNANPNPNPNPYPNQVDNPLSSRVNRLVNAVRSQRPHLLQSVRVLVAKDPLEARFLSVLTDDRAQASMSYVEFLCHIHRQIQSKFN